MLHSNLIMYLTAMSAVSLHNLANNFQEATRSFEWIDLRTSRPEERGLTPAANWTLEDARGLAAAFPQCNGSRQSPVLIDNSRTRENLNLRLGLTAYDKPLTGFLVNQFPTFRLVPFSYEWPRPSALISNSLARAFNPYADSHFELSYVQFYWRPGWDDFSSRVTDSPVHQLVNGTNNSNNNSTTTATPVEIHFVHTNTAYASLEEALARPDGLLIAAVLVAPSTHESYVFGRLLDELANLTEPGARASLAEDSHWRALLPADTSRFYRYQGSLTAPPCHESVQWIVFDERLKLGHKQLRRLRRFRFLSSGNSGSSGATTSAVTAIDWSAQRRPLQPLNGRVIERSFRPQTPARLNKPKVP